MNNADGLPASRPRHGGEFVMVHGGGRLTLDHDNGGAFQQLVELRLGGDVFYGIGHCCVCCQSRQLWLMRKQSTKPKFARIV
jgi:hypothetical protein